MNGESKVTLALVGTIGVLVGAPIVAVALPSRRAPANTPPANSSPVTPAPTLAAPTPTQATVDVTGSWVRDEPRFQQKWEFMFVQQGSQITGTRRQILRWGIDNPSPISTGIIRGAKVDILCGSLRYQGEVQGNRIVGADHLPGGKVLSRTFVKE